MADLLHEIRNLNEALDTSQKKIDRYAHLIASLSDELDNLRNNICHACKKKLVPVNASTPALTATAPSGGFSPSSTRSSPSTSVWPYFPTSLLFTFVGRTASTSLSNLTTIPSPVTTESQTNNATVNALENTNPDSSEGSTISPGKQWSVVLNPYVKQTLDLKLAHILTYESPVYCANISPDGQTIAVGLEKKGKHTSLKTGSNICVLVDRYITDPLNIYSVQFSPDGRLLATGAFDGQIRLWDIPQKRMRAMFRAHTNLVNSIVFSPNGRFLVSASSYQSVRIWDIRSGSSRELVGADRLFGSVAFSPNGRYIATGGFGSELAIGIWDARTHKHLARWTEHSVVCVEFTPDGNGLLSGGSHGILKYWDVSSLGNHQGQFGIENVIPETRRFYGHSVRFLIRTSRDRPRIHKSVFALLRASLEPVDGSSLAQMMESYVYGTP